jgi:ribose 5-phosphate isomerase A
MTKAMQDRLASAKQAAGRAAAEFIRDGMYVGLGTGTTAAYFIEALIDRHRAGLNITTVATSKRSEQLALQGGLPMTDINTISQLDMTVDGADEIDKEKRMIKGGGGALLREKVIASMSKEMVVIVDSSKVVDYLGKFHLPVEIIPFAHHWIIKKLSVLGYSGNLRKTEKGGIYITDNGNYIYDIDLHYPCLHPEQNHMQIRSVAGVVDTGFFFKLAGRVVVGYPDGQVKIL